MHSEKFWLRKQREFEDKIIGTPTIKYKELNEKEKHILRKFYGRRLNNAREELGIPKRGYNSLHMQALNERKEKLKDYVRKNPEATSRDIAKFDQYGFLILYRRSMAKLREESGIEKTKCDGLVSLIANNPWLKKDDLNEEYKSILSLYFGNKLKELKKEIGCPIFYRKIDNIDRTLSKYSMHLKGYNTCPDEKSVKNIENLLSLLNEKEREIIKLKYGIDYNPMTLEEIGEKHKISYEWARNIINSAKKKLEGLAII
ncbi:MAG TPA: sigma factor-like helix-turn-helix DNA-binding protein [Candidatus Nanoarchaeia archaeon]|nr:sigma factor-like helix-turn-helix DNA-binding protein [Candidatus Nanoarchaeia archaeon]